VDGFSQNKMYTHSWYFFSADAKKLQGLLNNQMWFVTLMSATVEGLREEM
jgi:hypothetical protein